MENPGTPDRKPARHTSWLKPGVAAFVAGALTWHVVGFWSFVSGVVLDSDDPAFNAMTRNERLADAPAIANGSSSQVAQSCVALVLNRQTGATSPAPCQANAIPMRDAGHNRQAQFGSGPGTRSRDVKAWQAGTAVAVSEDVSDDTGRSDFARTIEQALDVPDPATPELDIPALDTAGLDPPKLDIPGPGVSPITTGSID